MSSESAASAGPPAFRFRKGSPFHADLKRRVDRFFVDSGRRPHADARMVVKSVTVLAWAAGSYLVVLLGDLAPWQRALGAASLGLAMAGIGFGIMHDANHGGYAAGARTNRVLGFALDLVGGSSYLWRHKHNVLHHTYTNLSGLDLDIGGNALLRFSPDRPHRPFMRWQHLYVWALFAVYPLGWWVVDDFKRLVTGTVGGHRFPRPGAGEVIALLLGKAVFFGWTLALPLWLHPASGVLALAAVTVATLGVTLATTFQLAHCVGEADFPAVDGAGGRPDWAAHQVRTTVDFARGNRLLGWYLGGLNFQVEHHLFPRICHVHYPAISRIVEATCAAHGVRYTAQPTLRAALAANVRWLRALGRPIAPPCAAPL